MIRWTNFAPWEFEFPGSLTSTAWQVVIKALMADLTPVDFKRLLTSCVYVCVFVCACVCEREKQRREEEKMCVGNSERGSPHPYTNRESCPLGCLHGRW